MIVNVHLSVELSRYEIQQIFYFHFTTKAIASEFILVSFFVLKEVGCIINRLLDINELKKMNMGLDRLSILMYLLDTKNMHYKNLKKSSHKIGWFMADYPVH